MTITVISYIPLDDPTVAFLPGESFSMEVREGTTLDEFTARFFSRTKDQIGVMAVNGALASEGTVLSPGDAVELYPLLEGG